MSHTDAIGSYTHARSTKLLATHCLICGQPLRDPHSVETGIGPICVAKTGYAVEGNSETRAQVSKLIHSAAVAGITAVAIYAIADQIEGLGFPKVADKIRERFTRAYTWETKNKAKPLMIKVAQFNFRGTVQEMVWLHTPFEKTATQAFNSALKDIIPGSARTGSKDSAGTFWWVMTPECRASINQLLLQFFPGRLVQGPKGSFIVGEAEAKAEAEMAVTAAAEIEEIKARLLGGDSLKDIAMDIVAPAPVAPAPVVIPDPTPVPSGNAQGEEWGDLD